MSSNPSRFRSFPLGTYLSFARRYASHTLEGRRQGPPPMADLLHRPNPDSWPNDAITAAWLGHATVLMNFFGTWLVTDPALANRIGIRFGGITLGPRRLTRPALTARDLPVLDVILISHAHMDHLDLGTLRSFPRSTRVITHKGVGDLLRRFHSVEELGWGEHVLHDDLSITGIGARHWGARTLTDQQRGYGGFLLEKGNRRVLFAGDTAYTPLYRELAGGPIDLAILPIGAYDPWIANHANPEEAWAMARDMGATHIMPVHHSTFRLSREPTDEPLRRLLAAAGAEEWRVVAREIGETWTLPPGQG